MIQEGYSPSSSDNNRSFPLPTELRVSTGLSGSLSTGFPLHKGVPSLLYSPSMTSPYQCQFLSSKYQVVALYFSSLDLGLLCFRVIIKNWTSFLFSSRKSLHSLLFFNLCSMNTLFTAPFSVSSLLTVLSQVFFLFLSSSCSMFSDATLGD
jgi:hypothetical protein